MPIAWGLEIDYQAILFCWVLVWGYFLPKLRWPCFLYLFPALLLPRLSQCSLIGLGGRS